MPAEGFMGHVATDGSLLGSAGEWGASGWSVVQLDYDEELGPLHGMYGSMEAEFEVQRTIKRAELTAFLLLFKRSDWTHQGACRQQRNYGEALERRKKMRPTESWRCRFVDQCLGRLALFWPEEIWWSKWSTSRRTDTEKEKVEMSQF